MLDEQTLLGLIAEGKQEALEQLYAAYRSRLWGYLWHHLKGDAEWIEEVMQEVLLAIWSSASNYRGEAQPFTWVTHIAHNIAVNAIRTKQRRVEGYLAHIPQEHTPADVDGHNEGQMVQRLTLKEALRKLTPIHRDVLLLVFYYGFSCEEVAHILDIPVGTVKSRISHAKQRLLEYL